MLVTSFAQAWHPHDWRMTSLVGSTMRGFTFSPRMMRTN
jgi:hypothetical protein